MALPPAFLQALDSLYQILPSGQWAIRGTTSLVLQGLDMGLQDIDIIADRETSHNIDRGLADFCLSPLKYSETLQYKSYFGQYKIGQVPIEIMGDWQIKSKGEWSEIFDARLSQTTRLALRSLGEVRVTTIPTELKMFALMGRWTAYHKIKKHLSA